MVIPRFSRRRFLAFSTLAASAPLFAGCNTPGVKTASPSDPAAPEKGSATPGVLRYAIREEPTTLDPHLCFSTGTWDALHNTFEPLVQYDADNKLEPILLSEMPTVSVDGLTYTCKIKPGVRFHDDTPLTAEVVRANALRILSKSLASPRATLTLDDIVGANEYIAGKSPDVSGVKIVDAQTIRFVLTAPRAYFLDKLTGFLIASPTAWESAEKNERGIPEITLESAKGTGAFQLSEYIRQSKVVQTAFDGYHGEKPKLTRIERPIIIDAKTTRNLYDSDSLDIYAENVADYESDKADPATKNELSEWRSAGVFFVTLGQKKLAAMRDVRVRQALSRAIDRNVIAQEALAGMYPPATGLLAPLDAAAELSELPDALQFAPDVSRQLLKEAGYGADKPFAFTILYSEGSVTASKTTQVLKEQWAAVGVNVTLQEQEWGTLLKRMENGDFDAMYSGWSGTPDPHSVLWNLLSSRSPNNYGQYRSAEFDRHCDAGDTALTEAERKAAYDKAVAVALKDAPILPVVFGSEVRLIRRYVSGIRHGLGGMLPHTVAATQ
ncbi:MAG: ABC transporter substrate-binding protein [Armatimonadetes bacterium]|nr:ABC transporter substrate-binding protein [Armatimonadota bacterium]